MVKKISLNAAIRSETNGQAKSIRKHGFVPAVLYGGGMDPVALKVKLSDMEKAYREAGESSLINLEVGDKENYKVLVKDIQRDNIKNTIGHVDFYKVDMKKAIEVEIPLRFIGEAKAEKELGGTLNRNAETVNVKCLPGDLVEFIEVDISGLNTFEDMVHFSDLKLPEDMELLNNPEDVIVHVMEPVEEKVEEPVAEEVPAAGVTEPAEGENKKENK